MFIFLGIYYYSIQPTLNQFIRMYYSEGYAYVVSCIFMNSNFDMIENVRLYLVWKQDPHTPPYTLSRERGKPTSGYNNGTDLHC
jgi:hypothetical protein